MTAARIIAANPPRALAAARAVAAANEDVVCPDGKEKSDGGSISSCRIVSAISNGRSRATSGLSVTLHRSAPITSASAAASPYFLVLRK